MDHTFSLAAAAKSLQSCPTLCDPMDCSPPGSPIPGILQARTLEWVAISFSKAWKWKVKVKSLSHVRLLATAWTAAHQAPRPWDFPSKSTGVGCHCLLRFSLGSPTSKITHSIFLISFWFLSQCPESLISCKEQGVLKFLTVGTPLGGTNLDFQLEQSSTKGKVIACMS